MSRDAKHEVFMQKAIEDVCKAFAKYEDRRDRAAVFIFNNFERVLSLLTTTEDLRAEDLLHDLRIDFFTEESEAGFLTDTDGD